MADWIGWDGVGQERGKTLLSCLFCLFVDYYIIVERCGLDKKVFNSPKSLN